MNNYVAAIDLGTTKVVTLVGEKTDSGYKVVSYREAPSKGVMRGEVVNIQNVLDSLLPTIQDINRELEIAIKEVYVGIAGQNIKCISVRKGKNRSNQEELIEKSEIDELIRETRNSRVSPGEKILHVIPQSYNVDDHMGVETACGMTGTSIEGDYKLFIGNENSIRHSKLVINRAGLMLKEFILEPVASARAVLTEDDKELGVAMIDIGGGTTDLLIYHNNIIRHTAVIPFGGNSITEDIRQGCGVSLRNAEKIKIQFGSCYSEYAPENNNVVIPGIGGTDSREVSLKVIAGIIEARIEEIIEAVMYEIENSGYYDKLGAGVVITGGGAQLTNLKQFIKAKTGFHVRTSTPERVLNQGNSSELFNPALSTAVGLMILGTEMNEQEKDSVTDTEPERVLFPDIESQPVAAERRSSSGSGRNKAKNLFKNIPGFFGEIFDNTNNEA